MLAPARGHWGALLFAVSVAACGGGTAQSKAPVLPPANPGAVNKLAQGVAAAKEAGNGARAIPLLTSAVNADGKLWEARYNLGLLLAESGDLAGAEKQLSEARALAPNAEDVAVALAEVQRRRGDADAAAEVLLEFVKAEPKAVAARIALVGALRDSGDITAAIKHAREVLVRRSRDPNALAELAASHLARGEVDTAELLVEEALKADSKSAVAERTAGLIALKRGDDAVAFQHFAKASELDPKDTTARSNMATVLLLAGVYDRAAQEFRGVLEAKPKDVDAMIGLAAARRGQGKRNDPGPYEESERLLQEVLQMEPKNLAATLNLGLLYADFMQKPSQAKPLFQRFLDDAPKNHPARPIVRKKLAGQAASAASK